MLIGADVAGQFLPALSRVLGDTGLRQHAQALAARHAPARYGDVTQHVAERCIALAAAAVPAGTGC